MQRVLSAIAGLMGLIGVSVPACAQYFEPPRGGLPQGVGCYWHRGQHYCNRYCYREVDGHRYCQPRLRDAGSQAPPPVGFIYPNSPVYGRAPPADRYDRHPNAPLHAR